MDAAGHRFNREDLRRDSERWSRTPAFLLLLLIGALLFFLGGTGFLPRMRSILMSPPYADAREMATVPGSGVINSSEWMVPYSWVEIWRKQEQLFEGVAAYSGRPRIVILTIDGRQVSIASVRAEGNLFQVFEVKPLLGQTYQAGEAHSCPNCLVLSYQAWHRQFSDDVTFWGRQQSLTD